MTSCASSSSAPGWHLALEASGSQASVALAHDARVVGERQAPASSQPSEHLAPATAALLADAGIDAEQLAAVVVGLGPGSFTGLRVALATAKGLCLGAGVPLWGVSSLAIAAASAAWRAGGGTGTDTNTDSAARAHTGTGMSPGTGAAGAPVAGRYLVLDDARRGAVYLGVYDVDAQGAAHPACDDQVVALPVLASRLAVHGSLPFAAQVVGSPAARSLPWPSAVPPLTWAEDLRWARTALLPSWRPAWHAEPLAAAAPRYLRRMGVSS